MLLETGEVHVWWCESTAAPSSAVELLIDVEQERYQRFHFDQDRQSYLAAHAMVRAVLARYGFAGARAPFTEGGHGKPAVEGGPELNLSHTRGLVAAAFSRSFAVGVDVERATRKNDWRRLVRRVLAEPEKEMLFALPETEQQGRFYELWTAKEAWSKALGLGMQVDFRSLDSLAPDVFLESVETMAEFRMAVAAVGAPAKVVVRRFEWDAD